MAGLMMYSFYLAGGLIFGRKEAITGMAEQNVDLAKLEYEFATNPDSLAFIPLAEAYLKAGRYVEAMVVCKKGLRAHPELADARLIMARVYQEQGKHQKAVEEIEALLRIDSKNAQAFLMLGKIYIKLNREDQAVDALKKALDANPQLAEAQQLLLARGIDYLSRPATPPSPPPNAQPPVSERPTERQLPVAPPAQTTSGAPTQPAVPVVSRPPRPAPAQPVVSPRRPKLPEDLLKTLEKESPPRRGIRFTLYLVAILSVALIVYVIYTWQAGRRQEQINFHLQEGRTLFNKDNYGTYLKALEHYRAIIKLDKEHIEALSRAAFICAVLVGEHGAKSDLLQEAQKYIAQAETTGKSSTLLLSAKALVELYGAHNVNSARKILDPALQENPQSGNLRTALGLVLLYKGDLNEAKEQLLEGAKQPESMVRALVGLGGWAMRRSMYRESLQAFSRALQSNPEHLRSMAMGALADVLWGSSSLRNKSTAMWLERFQKADSQGGDKDKGLSSEMDRSMIQLAEAVLKARQNRAHLAELDALSKKYSSDPLFNFVVAREMRRAGRLKEAKEKIQLALRQDSSRPDFLLEEASIILAEKDFEGTRARAMRVEEMDAESGQASILIGDAYLGEKKFDKAIEYFKKAAKFEDTEALAHLKLGDAYLAQEKPDPDRAQAQYELAVSGLMSIGEGRLAAETCYKLSKIYASKQRTGEFSDILKTALRADPDYAVPYCVLARNIDTNDKDGREQFKELCQKCIALDGDGQFSGECKEKLKKL